MNWTHGSEGLPEAVVEGILGRNHPNVNSTILPDTIVGQHLQGGKPPDALINCSYLHSILTVLHCLSELARDEEHGAATHLFYLIDSNGEILAPLVDVVHQTQGQILEHI